MTNGKSRQLRSSRAPIELSKLKKFGSNPGRLKARFYVPDELDPGTALVVALHGSQQSAEDYANGAGWAHYAKQHGFALLLPEQRRSNNPSLSFNSFATNDNRRAGGEAQSIREMIEALVEDHHLDAANVFVIGLSAGGAMAIVMMATYPEVFAGGAVIAGLPYGCASGVMQAIDRMHGLGGPTAAAMEATIRKASANEGAWPTLSLWHGSADRTVAVDNVEAILGQWRALHGLKNEPTREDFVEGYPRRGWSDAEGRELFEAYSITGMGHGTPIEAMGEDGAGVAGAFMLDVNISSTRHIARFWGLAPLTPIDTPPDGLRVPQCDCNGAGGNGLMSPCAAVSGQAGDAGAVVPHEASDAGTNAEAKQSAPLQLPLLAAWQGQIVFGVWIVMSAAMPWWWWRSAIGIDRVPPRGCDAGTGPAQRERR